MTSIFDITDWAHVASFFVWTLAVCALAKAIFGSFPAAELQYRLALRDNPRGQRINRLSWEVANRTKWDEDVARGSQHAAVPLTEPELDAPPHANPCLVVRGMIPPTIRPRLPTGRRRDLPGPVGPVWGPSA